MGAVGSPDPLSNVAFPWFPLSILSGFNYPSVCVRGFRRGRCFWWMVLHSRYWGLPEALRSLHVPVRLRLVRDRVPSAPCRSGKRIAILPCGRCGWPDPSPTLAAIVCNKIPSSGRPVQELSLGPVLRLSPFCWSSRLVPPPLLLRSSAQVVLHQVPGVAPPPARLLTVHLLWLFHR